MLYFAGLTVLSVKGQPAAAYTLLQETTESGSRFYGNLGYVLINSETKISAITASTNFTYGLNSSLGVQASLEQAFSIPTMSSVYTLIELGIVYAVLGSLKTTHTEILFDGTPSVSSTDASLDTVKVVVSADQFFLNGSSQVVGLAGMSLAVYYDRLLYEKSGVSLGARAAIAGNGPTSIQPLQIVAGFFWQL